MHMHLYTYTWYIYICYIYVYIYIHTHMNQFDNICLKILHLYLCRMLLLFSCPVMSDSLWPHAPQHARPLCPSHQVHVHCISDAVQPSHPLTPPSLSTLNLSKHQELFQWVRLFASVDQNIGASASASDLPMCIQGWFSLRLSGLISLLSKGLSGVFFSTSVWRHWFFLVLPSLQSSSHNCSWPLGRP